MQTISSFEFFKTNDDQGNKDILANPLLTHLSRLIEHLQHLESTDNHELSEQTEEFFSQFDAQLDLLKLFANRMRKLHKKRERLRQGSMHCRQSLFAALPTMHKQTTKKVSNRLI